MLSVRSLFSGVYEVEYVARRVGLLSLSIELGSGSPIKGSPFKLQVLPSALDPALTLVKGDGASACSAGVPTSFSLVGVDSCGNSRLHADDIFQV